MIIHLFSKDNEDKSFSFSMENRLEAYRNSICFYCGNRVTENLIFYGNPRPSCIKVGTWGADTYKNHDKFCVEWIGSTKEIFLHPHCAEELAMHLIKDVRSGEEREYTK